MLRTIISKIFLNCIYLIYFNVVELYDLSFSTSCVLLHSLVFIDFFFNCCVYICYIYQSIKLSRHSFKYHNQHYFDIKTDYTMTFILPELSLCFVQRINITRNTNIKQMYMINVEKVTALKDPTCSAICILVLKRKKEKKPLS